MKTIFILGSLCLAAACTKWGVTDAKDFDIESAKKEKLDNARLDYIYCDFDIVKGTAPPTPRGMGPNLPAQTLPTNLVVKNEKNAPVVISQPPAKVVTEQIQLDETVKPESKQPLVVVQTSSIGVSKPEVTLPESTIVRESELPPQQTRLDDVSLDNGLDAQGTSFTPQVKVQPEEKDLQQNIAEPVEEDLTLKGDLQSDQTKITATDIAKHLLEKTQVLGGSDAQVHQDDLTGAPKLLGQPDVYSQNEELHRDQFRARRILANTDPYSYALICTNSKGEKRAVISKVCRKDSIQLIYTDKYAERNDSRGKTFTLPFDASTTRIQQQVLWPFFTDSGVTDASIVAEDCTITFKKSAILSVVAFVIAVFAL